MAKLKTVQLVTMDDLLDEEVLEVCGEFQAFVGENNKIIAFWYLNDANYRGEYMSDLLKFFGGAVSNTVSEDAIMAVESYILENY